MAFVGFVARNTETKNLSDNTYKMPIDSDMASCYNGSMKQFRCNEDALVTLADLKSDMEARRELDKLLLGSEYVRPGTGDTFVRVR